jgi:hypothetical protein
VLRQALDFLSVSSCLSGAEREIALTTLDSASWLVSWRERLNSRFVYRRQRWLLVL